MIAAARAVACAALLAALPAVAPAQSDRPSETVSLSIAESRALADRALAAGRWEVARDISVGLLQRDETDFTAWLILATAQANLDNGPAARAAARRALRLADTDDERFVAARVMSLAQFRSGNGLLAELWLRRAAEVAPDPDSEALAEREFGFVRARNPLRIQIEATVSPTSNVNNGSSTEEITLFDLPFRVAGSAQALSGVEYTFATALRYTLANQTWYRTDLGFSAFTRAYTLSDEARAQAPDVEAGDFAFSQVEIVLDHVRAISTRGDGAIMSGTLGRNWYGGDELANYGRARLSYRWPAGEDTVVEVGLIGERQLRLDDADRSAWVSGLEGRLWHSLGEGSRVETVLGYRETDSDAATVDHTAWTLSGTVYLGRPILGADLSLALGATTRDYPEPSLTADDREDVEVFGRIEAQFRDVGYLGFSPILGVSARETWSTSDFYDSREIGVRLGVVSTF